VLARATANENPAKRNASARCHARVGDRGGVGLVFLPAALLADRALMPALRPDAVPWLIWILQWATWLGYGLVDIGVPVAIGVIAWGRGDRDWARRGFLGGSAVAAAGLLDQVLKNLLCRARPSAADAGVFFTGSPVCQRPTPWRRSRRGTRPRRSRWPRSSRSGIRDGPPRGWHSRRSWAGPGSPWARIFHPTLWRAPSWALGWHWYSSGGFRDAKM